MTFTVVARDKASGLLGIAQSTNPLSVGARCPFIRANVGAVSTQAYTDPGLGPLANFSTATSPDGGKTFRGSPVSDSFPGVDRQWLAFTADKTVFFNYNSISVPVTGGGQSRAGPAAGGHGVPRPTAGGPFGTP